MASRWLLKASSRRSLVSLRTPSCRYLNQQQSYAVSSRSKDIECDMLHITSTPRAPLVDDLAEFDDDDAEEMVTIGPVGAEYGGPTRGGKFKEPTRFGDWERNGRCSDF
ncbi:hypothetical protein CCR75_009090 [Bremia lactucae]|uniref:Succinate dehydrogenase assembly factor 4, mitochondrial n=1 Tax=Bremia lactucae TaxID=4779 RepID=A0A976IFL6_BRELC|nr:hypothetical protein CCR75_009090 [Bremia lactucae]